MMRGPSPSMVITSLITLRELTDDYEVIVIDDGSKDLTALVLDELALVYPQEVRIVHHAKKSRLRRCTSLRFCCCGKRVDFLY